MRNRAGLFAAGLAAVLIFSASDGFSSQVQAAQNRIPQQIVINGQMVNAAQVITAAGQIQSFSCSSPRRYTPGAGSSRGWACYEEATGVWLMHAVPPVRAQAAPVPVPAPQAPAPVY